MRNLIFVFAMLFTVSAFSQETAKTGLYYCVQVVSTENPDRLQPIMFMAMDSRAMLERAVVRGRLYYRVIFIYESVEDQDSALHNWRHQWKDAIRVTKTEKQIKEMIPLFTEIKND